MFSLKKTPCSDWTHIWENCLMLHHSIIIALVVVIYGVELSFKPVIERINEQCHCFAAQTPRSEMLVFIGDIGKPRTTTRTSFVVPFLLTETLHRRATNKTHHHYKPETEEKLSFFSAHPLSQRRPDYPCYY